MEKKNNNGIIIGLLIGIIIMLLVFVCLFVTNTISLNTKEDSITNQTKENNSEKQEAKIYTADEYITLEDVSFNSKVSTKKVKFNHLDNSVTNEFYKDQEKIIKSIGPVGNEDIFNAEYKLKYSINNNILSVLYYIEQTSEIGTCGVTKAVTNIDLLNNKIITEEELLQNAGTSYRKITEEAYEKELESWKKMNNFNGKKLDYYEVTFDDFSNNKEKYINEGMNKISDIIYTYVEDGKIKYDYYTINMATLFHSVGKGGCFNWDTITLGDYK